MWHLKAQQACIARGRLIETAGEIAAAEGLAAVTTRRVAAEAGYTTGAVQHHFRAIDALRECVVERWCRQISERVLQPAVRTTNGVACVWLIAEAWLALGEATPLPFHELSAPRRSSTGISPAACLAADWFEVTRAALSRSLHLGELWPSTNVQALAFEVHALLWSTPWAWTVMARADQLSARATLIHQRLSASITRGALLPPLASRLPKILDVANRLTRKRARPAPHTPVGMIRHPYEDLIEPDDPERIRWEQFHGRPTESNPLPDEPDWWELGMEQARSRATPRKEPGEPMNAEVNAPPARTLSPLATREEMERFFAEEDEEEARKNHARAADLIALQPPPEHGTSGLECGAAPPRSPDPSEQRTPSPDGVVDLDDPELPNAASPHRPDKPGAAET